MAVITDPQKEPFRIGMLLSDTRYRSLTIQVIVLFLFMLFAAWVVDNTIRNLDALGKSFSFAFLWVPAGYDINQRLIAYTSQDPNIRAAVLGILNTLLLAVMGCVTATVIGVMAGVARLSKNWIVARLMTVYVEAFRNVPLLVWILLIMAAVNDTLPQPNAFRGENATASMVLWDHVALTNRGFYVPEPLFTRSLGVIELGFMQISLDFLLFVGLLVAGIVASLRVGAWADAVQSRTGERPAVFWVRLGLVIGPSLVALLLLGFHLGLPELRGFNFVGGIHLRDSLLALWIALSLYTGAFIAENVRAGILAVSKGQTEAASALGLHASRVMNLVVLPQAMRVIIPPLISQYLNLTKNSSLAIAVGYMDATGTLGGITLNQTGRAMECILLLMAFYLAVSLTVSVVMNAYNDRMKLKER